MCFRLEDVASFSFDRRACFKAFSLTVPQFHEDLFIYGFEGLPEP